MSAMKKKKGSGLRAFFTRKQFRFGWYSILLTVLVIAAVVVVNVIVGAAEDKWALKIDASPTAITKFTDQTYATLDALDQDIHVYLLFQKGNSSQLRTQLEEIAAKYRARSGHITVETIDPVTEPNRVNKYKTTTNNVTLSNGSIIVTNADETRVKLIPQSEMYSYQVNQQTGSYQVTSFNGESKLTQAIMFVTSESTPQVFFLTGHDEVSSSYCSTLVQQLSSENFEVKDLTLGPDAQLNSGDTVMILNPTLDLTGDEYDQLKAFLDAGGRMVFAEDTSTDMTKTPNFVKLLDYYGLGFKDGAMVEDETSSNNWLVNPAYIVPNLNAEHQITKDSGSVRLILPMPRAVKMPEMPLSGWSYTELLTTSAKAYIKSQLSEQSVLEREPADEVGKQVLAASAQYVRDVNDSSKDTRILVLGSLYTLVDSQFTSSSHNLLFSLSAFDWLVDKNTTAYVRSKGMADTVLSIPNQNTYLLLAAMVVLVIPGIILVAGIWVHLKRRRL